MKRKEVSIDTIPADGVELADDQLAGMLGGMLPADGGKAGSSKTMIYDTGKTDTDKDF